MFALQLFPYPASFEAVRQSHLHLKGQPLGRQTVALSLMDELSRGHIMAAQMHNPQML